MNTALVVLAFAAPVFPKWEKITIEEINKPVPEYHVSNTAPGSVSRNNKLQALPDECAIIEKGRVVGYYLTCK